MAVELVYISHVHFSLADFDVILLQCLHAVA